MLRSYRYYFRAARSLPYAALRRVTRRKCQSALSHHFRYKRLLPGHHDTSDFYFKNLLGNDFVGQGQPATVLGLFCADFGPLPFVLQISDYLRSTDGP